MNHSVSIKVSKRELDKYLQYLRDSGYTLTKKLSVDAIQYQADLDQNFGCVGESLRIQNRWAHWIALRIDRKP